MALFWGPVGNNLVLTKWGGRTGWSHQLSPFLVPAFHLSVYYFNFLLCLKVIIVHKQWVGMLHAIVWLGAGEKQLSCQVWEHGPSYKHSSGHQCLYLSTWALLLPSPPEGKSASMEKTQTVPSVLQNLEDCILRISEFCMRICWTEFVLHKLLQECIWSTVSMDLGFPEENSTAAD